MPVNVSEIILDGDIGEAFTILRSEGGTWVPGGYQQAQPKEIRVWGVVSMAQGQTVEQTPEGDRVTAAMIFRAVVPIYTTNAQGTSDIIVWRSQKYRVMDVDPYVNRGYYRAYAVRMQGD